MNVQSHFANALKARLTEREPYAAGDMTPHAPVEPKLSIDVHDHYQGDNYGTIYAHHPETGRKMGHLEFCGNKHSVRINMIDVLPWHRRQGVGSKLVEHLKANHPNAEVDWGSTTPEGSALKEHIQRQEQQQKTKERYAKRHDVSGEPRDEGGKWTTGGGVHAAVGVVVERSPEREVRTETARKLAAEARALRKPLEAADIPERTPDTLGSEQDQRAEAQFVAMQADKRFALFGADPIDRGFLHAGPATHYRQINGRFEQAALNVTTKHPEAAERVAEYQKAFKEATAKMTPKALMRAWVHLRDVQLCKDFGKVWDTLPLMNRFQIGLMGGSRGCVQAYYDADVGKLVVDGGIEGEYGKKYAENTTVAIYSHELGHVIDGPDMTFSKSQIWEDVWNREIAHGDLSSYATQDTCEGFAEFHRAVCMFPKAAKKDFPACWAAFKEWGLVF